MSTPLSAARQSSFKNIQGKLIQAVSEEPNTLEALLQSISSELDKYQIIEPLSRYPNTLTKDHYASQFLPIDAPRNCIPVSCTGNGNCLFNAISILLAGHEDLSTELRVRAAVALLQLQKSFTDPDSAAVRQLIHEQFVLYSPFALTDQQIHTQLNDIQILTVFKTEVQNTLKDRTWSGMWQIIGIATALQMSINSIYPNYNPRVRNLFNTTIQPLIGSSQYTISVLWSGKVNNGIFQPNHFVPLIDKQNFIQQTEILATCNYKRAHNQTLHLDDHTYIKKAKQNHWHPQTCTLPESNREQVSSNVEPASANKVAHENIPIDKHSHDINTPNENKNSSKSMDTENNPTPWSLPIDSYHPSFLKKLYSCNIFCSICNQRILAKQRHVSPQGDKICAFCNSYVKKMKTPPLHSDHMYPGDVPEVLKVLNSTELKLVTQVHPYMQMLILPAGGQHGLRGQSINLPVPMQEICSALPRKKDSPFIKIYSAKSDTYYQHINIHHVDMALAWLKKNNCLYKHILHEQQEYVPQEPEDNSTQFQTVDKHPDQTNDLHSPHENQEAQELCLVPTDLQIRTTNDSEIPTAKLPTVSSQPVNIFTSSNLEETAFPQIYPYGSYGLNHPREQQPTTQEYFRCRLLNKDKRWSSNPQYMFWALHINEQNKLQNAISIVLRNRTKTNLPVRVDDVSSAHTITTKTDSYSFMKQLRGTAAYWKNELSKLLAKLRTLGPPTFFMSLSANDMHWMDNFQFIDPSLSEEDISKMSYTERCNFIRDNPIMCALHFKRRWEAFLHNFLLSKPYPLGHIQDYFARIEFQARGTPHLHIFLWVTDAPSYDSCTDQPFMLSFIDKYMSGRLPTENPQHTKLVQCLQTHSHTHTCHKGRGLKCRFDFPMPVSDQTRFKFITDTGTKSRFYILQRSTNDIWINPYNLDVLQAWNANMDIQVVGSMEGAARYVCSYICKNEPFSFRQQVAETIKKMPPNSSQRKLLSRIGNILLTHRTIGLQETAYRLLGLEMVYSSRETVYINTALPSQRYRLLKPNKHLEQLPADSTNIFANGVPQYYQCRPEGEPFQQMSLAEFATKYKLSTYEPKTARGQPRFNIKIEGEVKQIMLRTKQACLRCNIPDVKVNPEQHFFSLLYLFFPFRNEQELIFPCESYKDSFRQKQNLIDEQQLLQTNLMIELEKSMKYILSLETEHLEDIQSITTPSFAYTNQMTNNNETQNQSVFNYDILNEPDKTTTPQKDLHVDMFRSMAICKMSDEEFEEKKAQLTISQAEVFEKIAQHDTNTPMHLFITGGAGTGKSFLLRLLREQILRSNIHSMPNVLVAAPTGVAAFNINALTLHSLLQLPTQDHSNAEYRPLSPRNLQILSEAFRHVQYLIIDEISMVSYNTLEHIHLRLNEIKSNLLDTDRIFGGISIITFGDLYQLRPVFGSPIFAETIRSTVMHLWKDHFTLHELIENKRQSKDFAYAQLLNRIRVGQHTDADIKLLQTRLTSKSCNTSQMLHIYPLKADRDKHNEQHISKTTNPEAIHTIPAIHDAPDSDIPDDDQKCAGIPRTLILAVNVRVMLIRNLDTQNGLVNGAQGTVHSIEWANPSGKVSDSEMPVCVNVVFDDPGQVSTMANPKAPIGITPITVRFLGKNYKYVTRTQLPLVLAFATTVHKVQGLTLLQALINLGPSIFSAGMAYVALSRVPSLSALHISELCPPRIYASDNVHQEMERLRGNNTNP